MAIEKLHEGRVTWAPAAPWDKGQPHPRGRPGLWIKAVPPQYEVFAPPKMVLSGTRTHSAFAWSIKEAREMEAKTEPCETENCDICEDDDAS